VNKRMKKRGRKKSTQKKKKKTDGTRTTFHQPVGGGSTLKGGFSRGAEGNKKNTDGPSGQKEFLGDFNEKQNKGPQNPGRERGMIKKLPTGKG